MLVDGREMISRNRSQCGGINSTGRDIICKLVSVARVTTSARTLTGQPWLPMQSPLTRSRACPRRAGASNIICPCRRAGNSWQYFAAVSDQSGHIYDPLHYLPTVHQLLIVSFCFRTIKNARKRERGRHLSNNYFILNIKQ